MTNLKLTAAAFLVMASAGTAMAQRNLVGEATVLPPGWTPSHSDAAHQFPSTGGTISTTALAAGPNGNGFEYKVAGPPDWGVNEVPTGGANLRGYSSAAAAPLNFSLFVTPFGDGWLPEPGSGRWTNGYVVQTNVPWSNPRLVGNAAIMGTWVLANSTASLHDDGINGDQVANDGISSIMLDLPVGDYDFKISMNDTHSDPWFMTIGNEGGWIDSGNISFTVVDASDDVLVEVNRNTLRYKLTHTVTVQDGPPYYGLSAAWGITSIDPAAELKDDGLNGDVAANDNVYSREFTVTTAGKQGVRVRELDGGLYPASNVYPIDVQVGQKVLVQFDDNVRTDGFSPSTRYVWTDAASRYTPTTTHVTGSVQGMFGGSNWTPNDANFVMYDDGAMGTNPNATGTDAVANDKVFSLVMTVPGATLGGPVVNGEWKVTAAPIDELAAVPPDNPDWEYQLGGEGDGLTRRGNNPNQGPINAAEGVKVAFSADAITGRVKASVGATTGEVPSTPNNLRNATASASSVNDWSIY